MMPNYKARGIQLGIVKGMNALRDVRLAREENDRKKVQFEADKKINDLKIKKLQHDLSPENLDYATKINKLTFQNKQSESKLNEIKLQEAEKGYKGQIEEMGKAYQQAAAMGEQGGFGDDFMSGLSMGGGQAKFAPKTKTTGAFTQLQQRNISMKNKQALNALKTGKIYNPQGIRSFEPVKSPEDFIAYASDLGVDLSDPEIKQGMEESGMDFKSYFGSAGGYTNDQERTIQENMAHYKRSREEVIAALKSKGGFNEGQ